MGVLLRALRLTSLKVSEFLQPSFVGDRSGLGWLVAALMAGGARDLLASGKIVLIDAHRHGHHFASRFLVWLGVGGEIVLSAGDMAERAVAAERGSDELHG